ALGFMEAQQMKYQDELRAYHDSCDAFLEAFNRCDPEREMKMQSTIALPAIVCAAFSSEVGLKLILKKCGVEKKGHDLFKLYSALPKHYQIQIVEGSGYRSEEFNHELKKVRAAFVEWRYIYEKDSIEIMNVWFLGKLAKSINYLANRLKNEP
ncbi:hypothetical protein ACXHQL_25775, partial [Vibrio parahaemolyticus]|uniref:hypothetical protein n=1 Tax=Vibrio parahaemolyticus TaxID=670 RepID=UPI001D16A305